MEEQIRQRIAQLEIAERDARMQLSAVLTVLAELRALLNPAPNEPTDAAPGLAQAP